MADIERRLGAGVLNGQVDELVQVPLGVLLELVEAARLSEAGASLGRYGADAPLVKELQLTLRVKLAAMRARGEMPALRSKHLDERDVASTILSEKLAAHLATGFVFARRANRPF